MRWVAVVMLGFGALLALVAVAVLTSGCSAAASVVPSGADVAQVVCEPVEGTALYQPCIDLVSQAGGHVVGEVTAATCAQCHDEAR